MVSEDLVFASYQVFRADRARLEVLDREVATKEVTAVLEEFSPQVSMRGIYSTTAFTAEADLMMWWISKSAEPLQDLLIAFRRTELGEALIHTHAWLGLVRPAEFTRDHQPAFVAGKEPKKYVCIYPFVRTPDWYLLEPEERSKLLREHGEAAREFPDVLANTTSAFGLGDYEWLLAFEADGLDRFVELIRRLRTTEARRYTKLETPFITGIRKDVKGAIAALP
jgi:hydrogen peroxide-dependent heme synthase